MCYKDTDSAIKEWLILDCVRRNCYWYFNLHVVSADRPLCCQFCLQDLWATVLQNHLLCGISFSSKEDCAKVDSNGVEKDVKSSV